MEKQIPDITTLELQNRKRVRAIEMKNYFPDKVNLVLRLDLSNTLYIMAIPKGEDVNNYLDGVGKCQD